MKKENVFNFAYSIGAAVVVIGAMGKIMHYSWSDTVLQISLCIEAAIFILIGIQELFKNKPKEIVSLSSNNNEMNNAELTESINNLNKTIKNVFNR